MIKRRNFGFVFFIFPYSEMESYALRIPKSKMDFRIKVPRQKQKHKIKKFFSRNTPPGFHLYLTKHTESIVRIWLATHSKGIATPAKQRAADRRRGRSFVNNLLLQKIFVQIDEKK